VFISLSPLFGTWLESVFGWTGSFYLFAIIAGLVLVHAAWLLPDYRVVPPTSGLWKSSVTIATHFRFMGFSLIAAIAFTCHFSFIAISPLIFLKNFGLAQFEFSCVLLAYGAAYVIGGIVASRLQKSVSHRHQMQVGMLLIGLAGGTMLVANIAVGGNFIGVLFPMIICTTGTTIARPAATSQAMNIFPEYAGAASSMLNTTVFITGGVTSGVVSLLAIDYGPLLAAVLIGLGTAGEMIACHIKTERN
jgi:predicted MFS family arabinose efflux permease